MKRQRLSVVAVIFSLCAVACGSATGPVTERRCVAWGWDSDGQIDFQLEEPKPHRVCTKWVGG